MVITLRIKSLMLLLLFITNVMSAMESTQQRMASLESPRQKKELPSAQEIKNMHFKREFVMGSAVGMLTLGFFMSYYYAMLYPCESVYQDTNGQYTCNQRKFVHPRDFPTIKAAASLMMALCLAGAATLYRGVLDKEYEARVFAPLKKAIKDENVQEVQVLTSVDVNMENYGLTPLRIALQQDKPALVKMLLQRGADPERGGHTALFDAVKYSDLSAVDLLLKHKANPNAVCKSGSCCGKTLLNHTISSGRAGFHESGCVQLLMQQGADPRQKNPKDNRDSYHVSRSLEVQELLEANKG